jgi:hypothetical protein
MAHSTGQDPALGINDDLSLHLETAANMHLPHSTNNITFLASPFDDDEDSLMKVDSPLVSPKILPIQGETHSDFTLALASDNSGATTHKDAGSLVNIPATVLTVSPDTPTDPSPFMRIPAELRVRVYKLLLLPAPVPRIECSDSIYGKRCSPGGRLLASTCKPSISQVRAYTCPTCDWRGGDVHLEILRASQQIYNEASAVLYENVEVVLREYREFSEHLFPTTRQLAHVRSLCVVLDEGFHRHGHIDLHLNTLPSFPNLKTIKMHHDVSLTTDIDWSTAEMAYAMLEQKTHHAEFVVDVHIVRAWDEEDGLWASEIVSREGFEERAKELDIEAAAMRDHLVRMLASAYEAKGREVRIRES